MEIQLLAITPDSERLIERAGRTCYLSFDKISDDSHKKFIRMIVKNGHHSVLEHAYATFKIKGGSRGFTHQLVRHRICAFSQQSQRYVNEESFSFVTPDSITENPEAEKIFNGFMDESRETYKKLMGLGIKKEDARFVLPQGTESEIVISANFREWRHIFQERCSKAAQWEIRKAAIEMLKTLAKEAPTVFEDFVINEDNCSAASVLGTIS